MFRALFAWQYRVLSTEFQGEEPGLVLNTQHLVLSTQYSALVLEST